MNSFPIKKIRGGAHKEISFNLCYFSINKKRKPKMLGGALAPPTTPTPPPPPPGTTPGWTV